MPKAVFEPSFNSLPDFGYAKLIFVDKFKLTLFRRSNDVFTPLSVRAMRRLCILYNVHA